MYVLHIVCVFRGQFWICRGLVASAQTTCYLLRNTRRSVYLNAPVGAYYLKKKIIYKEYHDLLVTAVSAYFTNIN